MTITMTEILKLAYLEQLDRWNRAEKRYKETGNPLAKARTEKEFEKLQEIQKMQVQNENQ